ncbi:T9SS type A sorting domain-containing protein [Chryseobacterium sp. C3]|uniref:T9SS type A sorting domain-containing protein n=1 Tax=Chryseobacterium sp. C3 TaxID=2761532 RepID=UPI00162384ED|nr:T9SS type A sorting domain-containing protein [Chryseobacterium sp. C3]
MKRKDFLKSIGIVGASVPLMAFTGKNIMEDIMDEPSNQDLLSCTATASETAGPYPTPSSVSTSTLVRTNITEGTQTGIALTLTITVLNTNNNCLAVGSGYRVDIWHCNKRGYYSAYSGQPGIDGTQNTTGQTWLRGIQYTNANGQVTFTSIYPGWYTPRATHIHVQIYDASNNLLLTTQLAFPDAINTTVNTYYATSGTNSVTNTNDMVFSDSYASELMTVSGSTSAGYTATANIFVAGTLGVDDVSFETGGQFSNLTISPNPIADEAKLSFNLIQTSGVSAEILDVSGRIVKKIDKTNFSRGKNELKLDFSSLQPGNYILAFTVSNINGEFSQSKKFIKK